MDNKTHTPRKRSQRDYTLGFKLSVIEQIEKGEITNKQAQARYGIQGRSTVLVWLRKHGKLDWSRPSELPMSQSDEGVHYLSLVTDASSRKIMGHELSHEMKARDTVKALEQAVSNRHTTLPLLHHSDRGSQYCSALYQSALGKHDIKPSMTDGYDCYQNALAERINGILKQEFLIYRCTTFADLKELVKESIDVYNRLRPHLSLGMKTPDQVHKKASCETQLANY